MLLKGTAPETEQSDQSVQDQSADVHSGTGAGAPVEQTCVVKGLFAVVPQLPSSTQFLYFIPLVKPVGIQLLQSVQDQFGSQVYAQDCLISGLFVLSPQLFLS